MTCATGAGEALAEAGPAVAGAAVAVRDGTTEAVRAGDGTAADVVVIDDPLQAVVRQRPGTAQAAQSHPRARSVCIPPSCTTCMKQT
ncbi:MAG: hypothetical protein ACRDPY_31835 [Streptosporangiaceae bacterium]